MYYDETMVQVIPNESLDVVRLVFIGEEPYVDECVIENRRVMGEIYNGEVVCDFTGIPIEEGRVVLKYGELQYEIMVAKEARETYTEIKEALNTTIEEEGE